MGATKLQDVSGSVTIATASPTANYTVTLPNKSNMLTTVDTYASADGTIGGTIKVKLVGSTLYIRTDGANA